MINPFKYIVKRSLQYIAANFGQHKRNSTEPQLAILMYHRVLPKDDIRARVEEPGMMVTPKTFRMHMQLIQQNFDVLPLSEWVKRKQNGEKLPSRCFAITFDDGWLDNYEFAFPVLKEFNLPATIFLVSDMVGKNQSFWPGRLARVLCDIALIHPDKWGHSSLEWLKNRHLRYGFNHIPANREELSEIIQLIKEHPDQYIHQHISQIENGLGLSYDSQASSLLNWQQIREMCQSGLIEVGSHTCHHIRLNDDQDTDTLRTEIIESKSQIEDHLGQAVEIFCYPNGDYCSEAVELVKQYYQCAVTTNKNWNKLTTDIHLLHRIGLHDDISADKTAFLARLSGWV